MPRILSEFHFQTLLIDGTCFHSVAALHDELSFKLGLSSDYNRNWDTLLDGLSSIGDPRNNRCSFWDWLDGKRLVISIDHFSVAKADAETLHPFLQVVATANERLAQSLSRNRIWIEYLAAPSETAD